MAKLMLLVAFAVAACSGGSSATSSSSASAAEPAPECKVDTDCACGTDKATNKCAFGPAEKIDTARQCPDFCTGIAGKMKIACVAGSCKQVKK